MTTLEPNRDTLALEVPLQVAHELELLRGREAADNELQNRPDGDVVLANEAAVVDVGEDTHEEPSQASPSVSVIVIYTAEENSDVLAVHTVRHSAVSRDAVAKVLNVEGALEP